MPHPAPPEDDSRDPGPAPAPSPESGDTPGRRSGNGSASLWEQMRRDEQRRKNPETGKPRQEGDPDC